MKKIIYLLVALLCPSAASAAAGMEITFIESAPKDRFVIKNTGTCELQSVLVSVDLSSTAGQLIFDTTERGAGVEVYQPFEPREGDVSLVSSTRVEDGQQRLSVRIESILPDQQVSFTIDVDDTLPNSDLGQIRVTGSEIQGGAIKVTLENASEFNARFGAESRAFIASELCKV